MFRCNKPSSFFSAKKIWGCSLLILKCCWLQRNILVFWLWLNYLQRYNIGPVRWSELWLKLAEKHCSG